MLGQPILMRMEPSERGRASHQGGKREAGWEKETSPFFPIIMIFIVMYYCCCDVM